MQKTTVLIGLLTALIGPVAYFISDGRSWTAFIPSIIGGVILILGLLAAKENLRQHVIHAALLVAIIGIAGVFRNLLLIPDAISGDAERPVAVWASLATFLLLVSYLVLGIRSFVTARKMRAQKKSA